MEMEFREYRRFESVRAAYVPESTMIDLGTGEVEVRAGSYVVEDSEGDLRAVSGFDFERECIPAAEEPAVVLRGGIGGATIKPDSDTGKPVLEVKLGFGTARPEEMGKLIRTWHQQNARVRVAIEPLWQQTRMFDAAKEPQAAVV